MKSKKLTDKQSGQKPQTNPIFAKEESTMKNQILASESQEAQVNTSPAFARGAVIKVIGVGGAGGNAINHMIAKNVQGVDFIAINTDRQALANNNAPTKIELGGQGLGAGADPDAGRAQAESCGERIRESLRGANMVFIAAGMGKGTGTGAGPVIAQIAKEMGILTVGVVSKPFNFEGPRKMRLSDEGVEKMVGNVDSLIVVLNEKLFEVLDEDATMEDAFACADNVLNNAVAGIAEIINVPGLINVDFADVRTIMGEQGKAMMGIGEASGANRARIAAEQAVASPLLDGVELSGAKGVIVNIAASRALKLRETNDVVNTIRAFCDEDATIIHGTVYEESMGDSLRVTVVATGIGHAASRPQLVHTTQNSVTSMRSRIEKSAGLTPIQTQAVERVQDKQEAPAISSQQVLEALMAMAAVPRTAAAVIPQETITQFKPSFEPQADPFMGHAVGHREQQVSTDREQATATVSALAKKGLARFEIPAFLRRHATPQ